MKHKITISSISDLPKIGIYPKRVFTTEGELLWRTRKGVLYRIDYDKERYKSKEKVIRTMIGKGFYYGEFYSVDNIGEFFHISENGKCEVLSKKGVVVSRFLVKKNMIPLWTKLFLNAGFKKFDNIR